VRNVRKVFGEGAERYLALDGIQLEVSQGELVCLLGPSGCGKSTLLNILAGFERASEGSVDFEGAPVRGAGRDRVMFFQDAGAALLPWLSVGENVRFALRVRKLPKGDWPAIIDKYLAMVGLQEHRRKFPSQLSGGMRQRLQIARNLVTRPRLVLLDEPTSGLDVSVQARLLDLIRLLVARLHLSALIVTHDLGVARLLAHRTLVMRDGRIVEQGLTDRVLDDPQHPYTQLLVSSVVTP